MSRRVGVILAGGRGARMGAGRNKALIELAGRPLLLHAVETFRGCCDRLAVVSAEADLRAIEALLPDVELVSGGETRHGSEWNALQALRPSLDPAAIVAFHDAARPLVLPVDVTAVFDAAECFGAAMLARMAALPALEVSGGRVARAYAAEQIWRAQTPQAARAGMLLAAYQQAADNAFDGTDTSGVLARFGYQVHVVPASGDNPKLTVPDDVPAAEAMLQARRDVTRAERRGGGGAYN